MTSAVLRVAMIAAALLGVVTASQTSAQERIVPSVINPGVQQFDDPNLVFADKGNRGAPLVVFMPGTNGRSKYAPSLLLHTIVQQGYRLIYLSYNDSPAVAGICPSRPPACSGRFRESRTFGGEGPPVATPEPEAIARRLSDLLLYLHREHPQAGWDAYIHPSGQLVWPRIVVSGLSQGAGMAAFLAKRFPVNRVVLFSSPLDVTGFDKRPAPWLFAPSATPPERWWAERHLGENTTQLIAHAYDVLQIPRDHILLFDGGLPAGTSTRQDNPYHGSTILLPKYTSQWQTMYGRPDP